MITQDLITGKHIEKTWNSETLQFDIRELSEQELNRSEDKPAFTSVPEKEEEDASFLTDVGRVGFSAVEGVAQLGSDVLVRPFQEDKEAYDESYSEWRGDMAEYVPGLDREDIIDAETGEVLRPETGAGVVLDVASYLVGGGVVFKALGKISKLQKAKITRGVIAEQTTEQVLADPDSNLFNLITEEVMDEPPAVIEFLAADKADDVLYNRAKMAVTSGLLTAGVGGLLNLGFKAVDVAKYSRTALGKEAPETPEEFDIVAGVLLGAAKKSEDVNPSKIVAEVKTVKEDTAEGVAQIINQSSGGFKGAATWLKQRWLTSRGFYSEKAQKASEASVQNQRQLVSHAGNVANRLQRFMDDVVEGNIVDDVNNALADKKLFTLGEDDKINYLTKEYGFSREIAADVADARGTIDHLSTIVLDSNIGSEAVREAIQGNMGAYMRRSYRLYEDADWRPSASLIEQAEDAIVNAKIGTKKEVSEEALSGFRTEAKNSVYELLDKGDLNAYDDYLTKIRKVNKNFLTAKKDILPEIRALMGEIESPTENIILTVQKLTSLTENNKFYNKLLELGGSVPSNPSAYDDALVAARAEAKDMFDLKEAAEGDYVGRFFNLGNGRIGKIIKQGTQKTQIKVKGEKDSVTINTSELSRDTVIQKDKTVSALAKAIYDKKTGSDAYTDIKYISNEVSETFNTRIKGTGSALDGQYTTKELARAINGLEDTHIFWGERFSKGVKNQGAVQLFVGAKGLQQQMRTVYDHTTHLRNALGGFQFGLANGLNPLKNGKLNFQVLKNEIGEGGNKVFDTYYEKLQKLGVVNTSVKGSEARALLDIARETEPSRWVARMEEYAKKYPDTKTGKLAEAARLGKKRPEQVYMATDDFFKMNGFFNELATLRKAHAGDSSWTEELLELEAAEIIKNTMPNYDRVVKGVKALREMPVGNFVSFPAEIARTSAHIVGLSMKEITSGNRVLAQRGLARLAGFSTLNAGWFAAGNMGYAALGFSETENRGLQTNAEGFTLGHNKQIVQSKETGEMFVHDPTYVNSYGVWQDIALTFHRELSVGEVSGKAFHERMTSGVIESVKTFAEPFTDEAMFTELMGDIYYALGDEQGRTAKGRQIFEDKENFGESIYDAVSYMALALAPGFVLDGKKYAEAIFETPNPITNQKRSLGARTIEAISGINFRKYKPEDNFYFHTKKYNRIVNYEIGKITPRYGKEGEEYFQEYSIAQSKKYAAAQELFRQIEAMRDIGWKDSDIFRKMKTSGLTGKAARRFLMRGQFRPDTISSLRKKDILKKSSDVQQSRQDIEKLQKFHKYLSGLKLQPIEEEDIFGSRIALKKISLKDFEKVKFKKGGEVEVPNAPQEPDERIDKMTGRPYHMQAGTAYMDDEDPLKRLGFTGGGQVDPLVRLGFFRGGSTYEIQSGDTRSAIARMQGVSQEELQALNEIEDPDKIFAGDELMIPESEEVAPESEEVAPESTLAEEFTEQDTANIAADTLRQVILSDRDLETEIKNEGGEEASYSFFPEAQAATINNVDEARLKNLQVNTKSLFEKATDAYSGVKGDDRFGVIKRFDLELEDKDYEGTFGGGKRQLHQALNDIKKDLSEGEINSLEAGLREMGARIDMLFAPVGELIGTVASAVTPDYIEERFKEEVAEIGENIGEWIQKNGYEMHAKNINAAISILGIIPTVQVLKRGINTIAAGTKTKLDKFYNKGYKETIDKDGNVKKTAIPFNNTLEKYLHQVTSAGIAFSRAGPEGIVDVLLPGMIARRRLSAAGSKRKETIREAVDAEKVNDAYASAIAGRNIVEQSPKTELGDLLQDSAIEKSYVFTNKQLSDDAGVRAALFKDYNDFDTPIEIQDRAMNHVLATWTEGLRGRPMNPNNTDVDVKRLDGPQNFLAEAHGTQDVAARSLRKIFGGDNRNKMANYITYLNPDGTIKAGTKLDKDNVIAPDDLKVENANVTKILDDATPDQIKAWLSYKGDKYAPVYERDSKGKIKRDENKKEIIALDRKGNPKKDESKHTNTQLSSVSFKVDEKNPNIIYWKDSHVSNSKESGGVNNFIAFDLKNKEVYTLISDKHDMLWNLNPAGGSSRLTIAPISKRSFTDLDKRGTHKQRDYQGEAQATLDMLEKYNLDLPEGGLTVPIYDPVTGLIPRGTKTVPLFKTKQAKKNKTTIDTLKQIANAEKIEYIDGKWKVYATVFERDSKGNIKLDENKNKILADGKTISKGLLEGAVHVNQTALAHFAGKATTKDYTTLARRLGKGSGATSFLTGESAPLEREGLVLGGLRKGIARAGGSTTATVTPKFLMALRDNVAANGVHV